MSRATPPLRDLSLRLMAYEAKQHGATQVEVAMTFRVCEKLRPHLATLMGNAGFRALLTRALTMAQFEEEWLGTVQVQPDGTLKKISDPSVQAPHRDITESGVILVANLLGLMVDFIGESLTLRMVHEVWPDLSLADYHFNQGDSA